MNVEEYERMYTLEDTYWWFQGRMRMIETILKAYMKKKPRSGRVLDVGCGTGLMLNRMKRWNPVGMDLSKQSMKFCKHRGIKNLMIGNVLEIPLKNQSMDLVLALDLIEHVENDQGMIQELSRVTRPGGYLMATVPAHQHLWSDHDIALHHHRRYSFSGFKRLLKSGGFEPVKYSYGITFTYHGITAFRYLQRWWQKATGVQETARPKTHLIPLPWFLNTPLIKLLHIEAFLLKYINLPFGISIMALCKKKEASD
jgi:ubiquinone/menaquinone biosynthesis C-methylase UbiE